MAAPGGGRERRRSRRYLPFAYFGGCLAMVLMVLPSALRPPPQQENQSAQLSPDSPKDQQQSVFAALNQASSGTAGTGTGSGPAQPGQGGPGAATGGTGGGPGPAPAPDSGYCPEGVGNPKRQIFSVYAPPCASKWAGDNGGATTFGVTATDIKVGVFISNLGSDGTSPGAVDNTTGDSPTRQAYRALEQYLNTRFQFYGRSLRLYLIQADQFSSSQGQAAADTAKLQYQSFATIDTVVSNYGLTEESVAQQMITMTAYETNDWLASHAPWAWTLLPTANRSLSMTDELICKQLAHKAPSLNLDGKPATTTDPRTFGVLVYDDPIKGNLEAQMRQELGACDAMPKLFIHYNLNENSNQIAGAITQMRAAGVTTVVLTGDWFSAEEYTAEASIQAWYPEWVHDGLGGLDVNSLMQGSQQAQWKHAVGVSLLEISRPRQYQDDYIVEQTIYPGVNLPSEALGWGDLLLLASGIQMAGPHLTPDTFSAGMFRMPPRVPDPIWSIGGGFYGADKWAYAKYAGLLWWDDTAVDPADGKPGAYRWLGGGKRYTTGEIPSDPLPFQKEGIVTPENSAP